MEGLPDNDNRDIALLEAEAGSARCRGSGSSAGAILLLPTHCLRRYAPMATPDLALHDAMLRQVQYPLGFVWRLDLQSKTLV